MFFAPHGDSGDPFFLLRSTSYMSDDLTFYLLLDIGKMSHPSHQKGTKHVVNSLQPQYLKAREMGHHLVTHFSHRFLSKELSVAASAELFGV